MIESIADALQSAGQQSLGEVLAGRPWLLALHALSDAVMALAFIAISMAIWRVLRRRRDLSRRAWQLGMLAMGLLVTATLSRLASMATVWWPVMDLQGGLKAATAVAAALAAIAIWPQIPRLLALPSPRDLARANLALAQTNESLETTIAWRTHEIDRARQRFEQAMSRSNITVFTLDRDLRYTWVYNPRLGMTEAEMLGRTAEELMQLDAADDSLALKREALETRRTVGGTVSVPTSSEGRVFLDMTVSPTFDQSGEVDGLLCTSVDVTEKRLFEVRLASMAAQLAAAYRRFELALEYSAITVFEQDADLRFSFIYNPPLGTSVEDFIGRTDAEIFAEEELRRMAPAKRRVLATGGRETFELEMEVAGSRRFFEITVDANRDDEGRILGLIGIALDLTDRKRDQDRLRLMMRELTHRSKNMLAVIQAMARKTATLSDDIDSFIVDFSARLRAMAAAQDLLVSQSWQGADLEELIRASVAQTIAPDAAQNLGLAFHELATNASKYGALAADAGELLVVWEHADGEVRICWEENGGPPVVEPVRQGFGRILLERLVGTTLNGSVSLDFREQGLICRIVFPDSGLIAA
jgi:PAS domain S-box-containing protein